MDFTAEMRPLFVPDVDVDYEAACVFTRVFTGAECAEIVGLGDEYGLAAAQVGARDEEYTEVVDTRRSRTAWIPYREHTVWIYDRLADMALRANRKYGFDLHGFTEDIQLTAYDEPDAFFDWHQDGLAGEVAVRKLSMVVQLSDPRSYRGADLELFSVSIEEVDIELQRAMRRLGTVIVFPAFEHHRVTPLQRGVRNSLVCWIGGPPFR